MNEILQAIAVGAVAFVAATGVGSWAHEEAAAFDATAQARCGHLGLVASWEEHRRCHEASEIVQSAARVRALGGNPLPS